MLLLLLLLVSASVVKGEQVSLSEGLLNQLGITIPKPEEFKAGLRVVAGNTVELPCNTTVQRNDSVRLVLWFKGEGDRPIYTYDRRGGQSTKDARHYSDDTVFKGRAYYRGESNPGRLVVEDVNLSDAGEYRCRTDFQVAPTRISGVNLAIIIPPEKPYIYDESSNSLVRHKLGPYRENEVLNLRCEVLGGNPVPEVTWWRDHTLLDTRQQVLKHKVVNSLRISGLTRADLHSIYTCQASNNNQSVPVSTSVKLDLTYGPELVKIVGMKQAVSAGLQYRVKCVAQGSRPPPSLTWFLGQKSLHHLVTNTETSGDGRTTTSTLVYTPVAEHNGEILRCRAELEKLPGSAVETSWNIIVYYLPEVHLNYGKSLDPENIKEKQDVYLECNVSSNPLPSRVHWRKDGVELVQDVKAGLILSNQTLVLQKVSVSSGGTYVCQAQNLEGTGESNPVDMRVRFAPQCRPGQVQVYGVGKHETVRVQCQVEADPVEDIRFHWRLNTSSETLDIQESQITSDGSTSWLEYTPRTELDYGTLVCVASNSVGPQQAPCRYLLVPAGYPDTPRDCRVSNLTSPAVEVTSPAVEVTCRPGFDGGLEQTFYLEVEDMTGLVVMNISRPSPAFSITGLEADTELRLAVYAENSKGRSSKVALHVHTPRPPQTHPNTGDQLKLGSLTTKFTVTPVLGILIGVGAALILVSLTIITILCCRSNYEKISVGSSTRLPSGVEAKEGCGPDLIPRGEDGYKQLQPDNLVPPQYSSLHRKRCIKQDQTNQDLDVLKHIHHKISRLGDEPKHGDYVLYATLPHSSHFPYLPHTSSHSPLLPCSSSSPSPPSFPPSACLFLQASGHPRLSPHSSYTEGVSSNSSLRDDYSPDLPLLSEEGGGVVYAHHAKVDRESAV